MKNAPLVCTALVSLCVLGFTTLSFAGSPSGSFAVVPIQYDPYHTHLVAAEWESGTGCPTNAKYVPGYVPGVSGKPSPPVYPSTFTDLGCPTGDPDPLVQGLLLVKTGPTDNWAYAAARIDGVRGWTVNEVGFDLRKPVDPSLLQGSQCDAITPRFEIIDIAGVKHFADCSFGATLPDGTPVQGGPLTTNPGLGWVRLRWYNGGILPALTLPVSSIRIMMDVGQDDGTYNYGLATLDNIDVNGIMVGEGAKPSDEDWGDGDDGDNHRFRFHEQPSQPQSGEMEYHDDASNIHMLSTNGVQAIAYNGSCVSFTGPATVNGAAGYMFNFEACDLSGTAPLALGTYAITITPPVGSLALPYSHNGTLNLGTIVIHPH